jgi:hypothetical protein
MLKYGLVSLISLTLAGIASAAPCYVLENNTSYVQTFHFNYDGQTPSGAPIELKLNPHARYPGNGQWCFYQGLHAYILVDNGAYRASWQWAGPLLIGDVPFAAPSGTYSLNPNTGVVLPLSAPTLLLVVFTNNCGGCNRNPQKPGTFFDTVSIGSPHAL